MKLSEHFGLAEFELSETAARAGIDNCAPEHVVRSLAVLCEEIMEPLRERLGALQITSGYRSPGLNAMVKGSPNSQHCKGQAADFVVRGRLPMEVCETIVEMRLPFDQCIHEYGRWTHVSVPAAGVQPRRQCLTIDRHGTRPGLVPVRS